MVDCPTEEVTITLPVATVLRLKAANVARNGALGNTASAMINEGIDACRARWPSFDERFSAALEEN